MFLHVQVPSQTNLWRLKFIYFFDVLQKKRDRKLCHLKVQFQKPIFYISI